MVIGYDARHKSDVFARDTAAVVIAAERTARSPGGVTIALEPATDASRAQWSGAADRARFLRGIELRTRVIGGR